MLCKTRQQKAAIRPHPPSVYDEPFPPKLPIPTPTHSSPNDFFVNRIEIETKNIDYDSNILLEFRFRFRFRFQFFDLFRFRFRFKYRKKFRFISISIFDFDYQPWDKVIMAT